MVDGLPLVALLCMRRVDRFLPTTLLLLPVAPLVPLRRLPALRVPLLLLCALLECDEDCDHVSSSSSESAVLLLSA